MKLLHILMNRRTFLQFLAALSLIAANLSIKPTLAHQLEQIKSQAGGYGLGAYNQDIYPGTTNKVYLPFISKEQ